MDKLSMSLDAIIANKKDDKPKKTFQKKVNHNNDHHQQQNRKFQPNKNFQKPHVVKVSHGHDDRFGGKFQRNTHNEQSNNAPQRQMKVVTIERPKVIRPDTVQSQPSHSSVFERLGKSGTAVVFRNLKKSVQQPDVYELCRAVGDVKEVQLHHEGSLGVARALFSNERDAAACIAKYHGLTLDGLEMNVTIENATPAVKSVFERLDGSRAAASFIPPELISAQQHSNIRSGLFGTALPTRGIEEDEVDYEEEEEVVEDDEELVDEGDDMEDEEEEVEENNNNQFTRRVNFGGRDNGKGRGFGGRGGGFGRGRGNGRGGGRGQGGGRFNNHNNNNNNGNNRRRTNNRGPADANDLDDDLDNYMADR